MVVGIGIFPEGVGLVGRLAVRATWITLRPVFINFITFAADNIDLGVGDNRAFVGVEVVGNTEGSWFEHFDTKELSGVNHLLRASTIILLEGDGRDEDGGGGGRSGHGGESEGRDSELHLEMYWYYLCGVMV